MSTITRNSTCPCGSGRKTKRCHPMLVGVNPEKAKAMAAFKSMVRQETALMLKELEAMKGYVPPTPLTPQERAAYRATGCPHGVCLYGGSEDGPINAPCAAPNCGV